jgi:hypothetical protein
MTSIPNCTPVEPPATNDDRLLIDVRELSRLTSLSVRTLRRMDSCGDIPGRVVVRRRVLYQLELIREWVRCGLPDRDKWQARQT